LLTGRFGARSSSKRDATGVEERELSNEAKGAWVCPALEDPAKCHQCLPHRPTT
jgi:hypothetical protein